MEFEIRADRSPQGRRKLGREREEYFRLMNQGLTSAEACKLVGINYRTGERWRHGQNPPGHASGMIMGSAFRRCVPVLAPVWARESLGIWDRWLPLAAVLWLGRQRRALISMIKRQVLPTRAAWSRGRQYDIAS